MWRTPPCCTTLAKSSSPDVLFKEEKLTAVEFEQIQCHVLYGYHILCGSQEPFFQLAANIAREHHERFDGSGYLGLHGREIDRYARMTAVADVFDALTTERTYKKAWSFEDGFLYILDHAGDFSIRKSSSFSRAAGRRSKRFIGRRTSGSPPWRRKRPE